ncbi:MAG: EFR1 family ferrodoxin [Spirochaetales bacterium]|nr:EFR1 family ferrodoxin [Spirochaetales bacterium]
MSIEIYYFTGTGNSLRAARGIASSLAGARLIPMAGALGAGPVKTRGEAIGLVFPVHGMTVPRIVVDFLKLVDCRASSYFFAVATRGGTVFRGFPTIERLLEKQGKRLNAGFVVTMAGNDPKLKVFSIPASDEFERIEADLDDRVKSIVDKVGAREDRLEKADGIRLSRIAPVNFIFERLVPFMVRRLARRVKRYFYADARCAGCGTCARVCPAGKIEARNGRPFWRPEVDCRLCYACLNFCPREAVQIVSKFWMKSYTAKNGRYPHPWATVQDMAAQRGEGRLTEPPA